ncbi:MAG: hypothetical protein C4B59_05030 [Candidatus Methanogaster sp.]|uniref:Uncharacterized protein n=1 Tax=Candidatus Methanogaster sp. TaxID=3386292 RepID=A0AC61L4E7_9EURY|nr:MAG: hypothetical protein C4B59_05030 [ANME-2 cluster archaeon]
MADTKEIHQLEVSDLFFGLLFISAVVIGAFSNILEDCTFTPYENWKGKRYMRIENHESLKSLIEGFWWIFNFFRVDRDMAKENPFQKILKNRHDLLRSAYTVDEKAISEPWLPPLFLRVLRTKSHVLFGLGLFKCCTIPFVNIRGYLIEISREIYGLMAKNENDFKKMSNRL